jgi:hypothetical protein
MVRRSREQLEQQIDSETGEPMLRPIRVELLGDRESDSIPLPGYLQDAFTHADNFCKQLAGRIKSAGFLKTLLLRRVGSSIEAGRLTAHRLLESWSPSLADDETEDDPGEPPTKLVTTSAGSPDKVLNDEERRELEAFLKALQAYRGEDPKYQLVMECLRIRSCLAKGCIVFSQYRDSIRWLAQKLGAEFPTEPIAV